jgi:hypothetical protein
MAAVLHNTNYVRVGLLQSTDPEVLN